MGANSVHVSDWEESSKTSQRILTLLMAVLCLILYTMFCSGLISSLSIGSTEDLAVEDLVKLGYKFGVANTSHLIISEHQVQFISVIYKLMNNLLK